MSGSSDAHIRNQHQIAIGGEIRLTITRLTCRHSPSEFGRAGSPLHAAFNYNNGAHGVPRPTRPLIPFGDTQGFALMERLWRKHFSDPLFFQIVHVEPVVHDAVTRNVSL